MKIITSESVTKGHPDKICDIIADTILDACLDQDPESRVACEVCCTTGTVVLMGEITTNAIVDYKELARNTLKDLGYTDAKFGIGYDSCSVIDLIDKQSPEISNAVGESLEVRSSKVEDEYDKQGAGDQGIIFGYACSETKELMPLSHMLANNLARRLEEVREDNEITWLRPDGKTQVSIAYDEDGKISHIDTILISAQHDEVVDYDTIYEEIMSRVILVVLRDMDLLQLFKVGPEVKEETKILINPSGSFSIGGPHGDTGLTGRKLAVDTYGGHARFGGGAMSGKCPSKVDRSAAYMARYIAKHIVASKIAERCEVQLSYAIGKARPVSINVNTMGTGYLPDTMITALVEKLFDTRPLAIINDLELKNPIYRDVARQCHFGNYEFPWEILKFHYISGFQEALEEYRKSYIEVN